MQRGSCLLRQTVGSCFAPKLCGDVFGARGVAVRACRVIFHLTVEAPLYFATSVLCVASHRDPAWHSSALAKKLFKRPLRALRWPVEALAEALSLWGDFMA